MKEPISEIFKGDCLEKIKTFDDCQFELAVIDPPYGIDINSSARLVKEKGRKYKDWDKQAPGREFFDELFRVSKNVIIWGANHFIEKIPINSKCWLVWDKQQPEGISFAMCELALTTFDNKTAKIFRYSPQTQNNTEIRIHPTQKPVALYTWIFQNFTKPGDKILDTHLGSGSSRIAAYKMGLDFWGCEIDPEYYEAQEKRFQMECKGIYVIDGVTYRQTELFKD